MATFLDLPLELREQIYGQVLPCTVPRSSAEASFVTWRLGEVALLATCRQIYEECANIIYGSNIFEIAVEPTRTVFCKSYSAKNSPLRHFQTVDFHGLFSGSSVSRMKKIRVTIRHSDDFTSMTKYNCGGRALNYGLRLQVEDLVDVLHRAEPLRWMQIHSVISDSLAKKAKMFDWFMLEEACPFPPYLQDVLLPFSQLSHVKVVVVTGAVTTDFAKALKCNMSKTLWISPTCH